MQEWLRSLQAEANQEPAVARVSFYAQSMKIGSVEPSFMHHLTLVANKYGYEQLLKKEQSGWHLMLGQSDVTTRLNELANLLRNAGLAGAWRNEQLAVRDELG